MGLQDLHRLGLDEGNRPLTPTRFSWSDRRDRTAQCRLGWNSDNGVSVIEPHQGFGRLVFGDAIKRSQCLGACGNCVRWPSRLTLPVCMQVGILTAWEGDGL